MRVTACRYMKLYTVFVNKFDRAQTILTNQRKVSDPPPRRVEATENSRVRVIRNRLYQVLIDSGLAV